MKLHVQSCMLSTPFLFSKYLRYYCIIYNNTFSCIFFSNTNIKIYYGMILMLCVQFSTFPINLFNENRSKVLRRCGGD